MLNVKKLFTDVLEVISRKTETEVWNSYVLGTAKSITPKPYPRLFLIVPTYNNINSGKYQWQPRIVPANTSSITIPNICDGSTGQYTLSATLDIFVVKIPIMTETTP